MNRAGRYAPSPSGPLHLGNLRTALFAWLQARWSDARFILRMEDLDRPRTRPGAAQQILHDLHWLGLDWDEGPDLGGSYESYIQSECDEFYNQAFDALRKLDLVYPCFCSRKEWQEIASAPHGKTLIYPGTCRTLDASERDRLVASGKQYCWRIRVTDRAVSFDDRVAGRISTQLTTEVGDFVIKRAGGLYAYHLAVTVDDARMGITDVVRGADLLGSTPHHIYLQQLLGYPHPHYWHVPLMQDESGRRMSKRDGAASIEELRKSGMSRQDIIQSMLANASGTTGLNTETPAALLNSWNVEKFRNYLQLSLLAG